MNKFFKLTFTFLCLALGIWSCEKEETLPQPVNKLEAMAGTDQQVTLGTLVQLNGSASKDGHGKAFTFSWSLKSKPANSQASLNQTNTATPSFTPDAAGTYIIILKISNSLGFDEDEVSVTASAPQPQAIFISDDIAQDRVLENIFNDPSKADYIVTADVVVRAKLSVKPGVRIEFEQDKSLKIFPQGALIAKGEQDNTGANTLGIVFTGRTATKGFWKGILLASNNPLNEMAYVTVEYAGSSPFTHNTFAQASGNLVLENATLKVSHSLFYNGNATGMAVLGHSQLLGFANNYFENNSGPAISLPAHQLHKLDFHSHFTGNNGIDGVVTGGTVRHDAEVVWPDFNDGSSYYVNSDLVIESGVRIQPGAAFMFEEKQQLLVMQNGYLNAVGTPAGFITFTARRQTKQHNWGGLVFLSSNPLNRLHYTEVAYAGNKDLVYYPGMRANVAVATSGMVTIDNSILAHGLGWGLLAYTDQGAKINANAATVNSFQDFGQGFYKLSAAIPYAEELAGTWLDEASFKGQFAFDAYLYERTADRWFGGASSPWAMNPRPGIGLRISEDGSYVWTILMAHDPVGDCGTPYSAEYITGKLTANGQQLQFRENFWRSKFVNPCDASQNVDTDVTPGNTTLTYRIDRVYDLWSGTALHWEMTFINPDGTSFKYYKR